MRRWRSYRDGEDELRLRAGTCLSLSDRACAARGDRRKRTEEEDGGVAAGPGRARLN